MKNKNVTHIANVTRILIGCTMAGAGVFLVQHGGILTARGVLPYLQKATK